MMEKIRPYVHKIVLVSLVVLLAVAAAGDYVFIKNNNSLQKENGSKAEQVTVLGNKLSVATTEIEALKKKYESSAIQCKTKADDLHAQIAAFAKQAAACEQIKQKLHIK